MDYYIEKVKDNLDDVRSEMKNILNILDDSVVIDDNVFQSNEVNEILNSINIQTKNLKNYIIPAIERISGDI